MLLLFFVCFFLNLLALQLCWILDPANHSSELEAAAQLQRLLLAQQRWDQLERLFTCRFEHLKASERETPGFREHWKELHDEYCDDEASYGKAFRALWHHPDQRLLYRYTWRGQRPLLWTLSQLNLKYPLGTVFLPLLTPRDQHSLTLVDYYSSYWFCIALLSCDIILGKINILVRRFVFFRAEEEEEAKQWNEQY
jgi:hypothetical protein